MFITATLSLSEQDIQDGQICEKAIAKALLPTKEVG